MNEDSVARGAAIILNSRYLTLATAGEGGAWASPVSYTRGRDGHLYYYSALAARHSRNIAAHHQAAAAIFDSQASSDDADGIQLKVDAEVVSETQVAHIHGHYYRTMWPDPTERANWEQMLHHFKAPGPLRFYRLIIREAFVLDLAAYEVASGEPIIDQRAQVDVAVLRHLISHEGSSG